MDGVAVVREIAIVCNAAGVVQRVLHDALGITKQRPSPLLLLALVDHDSREKGERFLACLRERGVAMDWELNVAVDGRVFPLHFAGGWTEEGYCIIGASEPPALHLLDAVYDLIPASPQQRDTLRAMLQQQRLTDHAIQQRANDDYEEITRLNNELVCTQRDLAQRNATLARTIGELQQARQALEVQQVEIERMNAQLAQRAEALERSNRELQQFAFLVSHDLQAPLRAVSNFVQLLQKHYEHVLDDRAGRWLGHIVQGARHMSTLIQDILAYARVNTSVEPGQSVPLTDVIVELQEVFASKVLASGGQITYANLPVVEGNRSQFKRLLQNLVENGLTYHSGVAPCVHIAAAREAQAWRIDVRDNGIGIAPEQHRRIFEIFSRLHRQQEYAGTGIGLAICYQIVQRHGGSIWVNSTPGQGSTFSFTIPDPVSRHDPAKGEGSFVHTTRRLPPGPRGDS